MSIRNLSLEEKRDLAAKQEEKGIWFKKSISTALGSINAALLFSQLYYLQSGRDPRLSKDAKPYNDGWVWKTREEWCEETTMTKDQLETARRILRDAGLLEEQEERMKHRIQYRLIPEAVFDYLLCTTTPPRRSKTPPTEYEDSLKLADSSGELEGKASSRRGCELEGKTPEPRGKNTRRIYIQKNTANTIPATPECPSSESPDSSAPPIPTSPLEHSPTPSVVDLPPTTSAAAPPFNSDDYIDDMMDPEKEKNPAVRLIGNYLFFLGNEYPSAKAIRAVIPRNISLAKKIIEEGWTEEEMEGLMESLANDPFWKDKRWTLSFFKDRLPKFRAELAAKKNQKIVRHL